MSEQERDPGAPRHRTHYQTDVNLVVATQAFRRRPLRISAEDLAAPLHCGLSRGGEPLGDCTVLDVSAGGIGIVLGPTIELPLGTRLDEVRLEQDEAIVAYGPAEVVNVLDGAMRRAGLRLLGAGVDLRNLRLRDGAPVDPGGISPEAASLPTDWRAAVAELGQVLRRSGFFLDHATRPIGDQLTAAEEQAVFSDFYTQWGPRCLGSLARLHDLGVDFDQAQRAAAREHARQELAAQVFPGRIPRPPRHGAIDDYELPALFLSPGFDGSTLHARFMRYAWTRFPLVRTILARPRWLPGYWDELRGKASARVLVIQPGPAAELSQVSLPDGHRVEVTLLETEGQMRGRWDSAWRKRWAGPSCDLHVGARSPTGVPRASIEDPPYDLVYGAGVLGGLRDSDARAMIRSLYARLRRGGRLVLGNLQVDPATTWLLDHVLGWQPVYRSPEQLAELASSLESKSASFRVVLDPTERASVLEIVR
ncbi:MAG: PilZ domain-containing protein [Nannocystaceae bacterium]